MTNDSQSLSHTKWNCKYHIVFAPEFRRQVIYGQIKADIGKILRQLCEAKKVEIIEAEACPDHIHMLVSIPPYLSVSKPISDAIFKASSRCSFVYFIKMIPCLYAKFDS